MAQGEVIKEFLVSLGFKVDTSSFKKFSNGIEQATKGVAGLGGAVASIASGVAIFVTKFAESAESLYFFAQRSKSSANNIKALEFAARQIGITAEEAGSQLDAFSMSLRNPGKSEYLKQLGVQGKDSVEKLKGLLDILSKMREEAVAFKVGELFGVSPQLILAYKNNTEQFNAEFEKTLVLQKKFGTDANKAGEDAHEFMSNMRDLGQAASELGAKIGSSLLPVFNFFSTKLTETLRILGNIDNYKFNSLEDAFQAIKNVIVGVKDDVVDFYTKLMPQWLKDKLGIGAPSVAPSNEAKGAIRGAGQASGNVPLGLRQHNPGNLRRWAKDGETSNGFAVFKSDAEGLSAMAGNLLKNYADLGITSLKAIIAKYAPPGDKNDTDKYISDIAKQLGIDPSQKNNLYDPSTLARLMGAMVGKEQGFNPFGTQELLAAAQSRIGGSSSQKNVSINQTNHINVQGTSGDPSATGRIIGQEVSRVYGDSVRYNKAAFN